MIEVVTIVVGVLVVGTGLCYLWAFIYSRRQASARRGESRETFVKELAGRGYDRTVLEAVHDSLQDYWRHGVLVRPFPLRETDRIVEDLCIDPEEFDRVMETVTKGCGRTWVDQEVSVVTVEDLIRVVQDLPEVGQVRAEQIRRGAESQL